MAIDFATFQSVVSHVIDAGFPVLIRGRHGVGNARFKSSTNRAPRRTTPGDAGEHRVLRLQLKLQQEIHKELNNQL